MTPIRNSTEASTRLPREFTESVAFIGTCISIADKRTKSGSGGPNDIKTRLEKRRAEAGARVLDLMRPLGNERRWLDVIRESADSEITVAFPMRAEADGIEAAQTYVASLRKGEEDPAIISAANHVLENLLRA